MKLNTRVRYAVRMMADIATHGAVEPVPLKDVAERQRLSKLYLSQLASPLRNASLLKSTWGNKGGYLLGRSPRDINLLHIIEAVEGPVGIVDCVLDPHSCDRIASCKAVNIWRDINAAVSTALERYTLEDLMEDGESHEGAFICFGQSTSQNETYPR